MISYGGISLVHADQDLYERASRAARDSLREFPPAPWPAAYDGPSHGWLHTTLAESWHPTEINILAWPQGASRFACAHFLAHEDHLTEIRQLVQDVSGLQAQTLILDDGRQSIETDLYFLCARPLEKVGNDSSIPGLHLITLVDERYFWWQRGGSVTATGTWATLYSDIATLLGIEIAVEAVNAAYGSATPNFTQHFQPLPPLLDSVAEAVGHRIVRRLDGTVHAISASTSATLLSVNRGNATRRLSGGQLTLTDLEAVLPSEVKVTFRHTDDDGNEVAPYTVTVATGAIGVSDAQKILWRGEVATGTTPSNSAALTTLATQAAADWYDHQVSTMDETFEGFVDWSMEGLTGLVEYAHRTDVLATRCRRWPWEIAVPPAEILSSDVPVPPGDDCIIWYSVYLPLYSVTLTEGDDVTPGQQIGTLGNPSSGGSSLHWSLGDGQAILSGPSGSLAGQTLDASVYLGIPTLGDFSASASGPHPSILTPLEHDLVLSRTDWPVDSSAGWVNARGNSSNDGYEYFAHDLTVPPATDQSEVSQPVYNCAEGSDVTTTVYHVEDLGGGRSAIILRHEVGDCPAVPDPPDDPVDTDCCADSNRIYCLVIASCTELDGSYRLVWNLLENTDSWQYSGRSAGGSYTISIRMSCVTGVGGTFPKMQLVISIIDGDSITSTIDNGSYVCGSPLAFSVSAFDSDGIDICSSSFTATATPGDCAFGTPPFPSPLPPVPYQPYWIVTQVCPTIVSLIGGSGIGVAVDGGTGDITLTTTGGAGTGSADIITSIVVERRIIWVQPGMISSRICETDPDDCCDTADDCCAADDPFCLELVYADEDCACLTDPIVMTYDAVENAWLSDDIGTACTSEYAPVYLRIRCLGHVAVDESILVGVLDEFGDTVFDEGDDLITQEELGTPTGLWQADLVDADGEVLLQGTVLSVTCDPWDISIEFNDVDGILCPGIYGYTVTECGIQTECCEELIAEELSVAILTNTDCCFEGAPWTLTYQDGVDQDYWDTGTLDCGGGTMRMVLFCDSNPIRVFDFGGSFTIDADDIWKLILFCDGAHGDLWTQVEGGATCSPFSMDFDLTNAGIANGCCSVSGDFTIRITD